MCSLARVDGYRSAMNSAGLPIDPAWIRFGDFHVEGGRDRARELLALPDRPRRSSRAATSRRSASLDAVREAGLRFPTTCRSWATTTSRSPAG